MRAAVVVLFVCVFFIPGAFAYDDISMFYKGAATFDIQDSYSFGSAVTATITACVQENVPLADAQVVVNLVSGCSEPTYPSQESDCDNVFYEEVLGGLNIPPGAQRDVLFSYVLPQDIASGDYRMDVYFLTKKTPITGVPYIFLPGVHKSFTVAGQGSFPYAKILRTKTRFNGATGPVGVGVDAGSPVAGEVFIQNTAGANKNDMTLYLSVCEWDDVSCGSFDAEKTYPVSLDAFETKAIDVSFTAPAEPSAYAIRLELKEPSGRTVSLYRSRIVVKGETAKIRKLVVSKPYFKAGDKGEVFVLVGASPDHYTNPVVENVRVKATVRDLEKGMDVFEGEKTIAKLSSEENLVLEGVGFEFAPGDDLKHFKVCATVMSSSGREYDNYCYVVDSAKFAYGMNYAMTYDYANMELSVALCVSDNSGFPVSSHAELILLDTNDTSSIQVLTGEKIDACNTIVFSDVIPSKYSLIVTDSKDRKQRTYDIDLASDKNKYGLPDTGINLWLILGVIVFIILFISGLYLFKTRVKMMSGSGEGL